MARTFVTIIRHRLPEGSSTIGCKLHGSPIVSHLRRRPQRFVSMPWIGIQAILGIDFCVHCLVWQRTYVLEQTCRGVSTEDID